MELSIKITDEMLKKALDNAMENIETITGISLMECVERQIPKKPKVNEYGIANDCPNCGHKFEYYNAQHCPDCGQAVDWGEA